MIERPASRQPLPPHAKKVFSGVIFDVYHWEQQLYDGTTATFEKLVRGDTAVIIPALADGTLLIEEELQPGSAMALCFPAGRLERGEDPQAGARRELLEETGYEPAEMILWKAVQPSSIIDWVVYVFIARGCRKVAEQDLDAGERITTRLVSLDEALELSRDSLFQSANVAVEFAEARHSPEARAALEKTLFGK